MPHSSALRSRHRHNRADEGLYEAFGPRSGLGRDGDAGSGGQTFLETIKQLPEVLWFAIKLMGIPIGAVVAGNVLWQIYS
jgi:hypothetical protein